MSNNQTVWTSQTRGDLKFEPYFRVGEEPSLRSILGPDLPVLRSLTEAALSAGITIPKGIKFVAVQHMVRTNLALFRSLFQLGLAPQDTFVIGKGYSTSPACLKALQDIGVQAVADLGPPGLGWYGKAREEELRAFWRRIGVGGLIKRHEPLIVADVGGRLLSLAGKCEDSGNARNVVGIELTTSGIRRLEGGSCAFPIINVAQAAAKSIHESPLVAETIIHRLDRRRPGRWPRLCAGVIGLGDIGQAMAEKLEARGFEVIKSDISPPNGSSPVSRIVPLSELVKQAGIVFGCTGSDIFKEGLPAHQPGLILVSCSSEDVEFGSLLREIDRPNKARWPAPDVTIDSASGPVTIISGGYPVNFDTSGVSVAEDAIQVTTALMLAAVLAATTMISGEGHGFWPSCIQVPAVIQSAILTKWRALSGEANYGATKGSESTLTPGYFAAHSAGYPLSDQGPFSRIAGLMLR